MRDQLLNIGMPAWQADGLIEDYAHYQRNEAAVVSSGIQDAIDKDNTPDSFEGMGWRKAIHRLECRCK